MNDTPSDESSKYRLDTGGVDSLPVVINAEIPTDALTEHEREELETFARKKIDEVYEKKAEILGDDTR